MIATRILNGVTPRVQHNEVAVCEQQTRMLWIERLGCVRG